MTIHSVTSEGSVAVILGSAFSKVPPRDLELTALHVHTPWGPVEVHQASHPEINRPAYLLFRHGLPHQSYPQQVNFRAHAAALKILSCEALLVTSSVGVLDRELPLDQPLLVNDLLMPDHRLPNGELCTTLTDLPPHMQFDLTSNSEFAAALRPGHLVLRGPICAQALDTQIIDCVEHTGHQLGPSVTFAYVAGPRTKTPAENHYWSQLGAQVNSMSVGPEIVLANELEIPTSALVIGHKYSSTQRRSEHPSRERDDQDVIKHDAQGEMRSPTPSYNADHQEMSETLNRSHQALEHIVTDFLCRAHPVNFPHYIYRYQT